MIGVIANPSEHFIVGEFFELFKTPWEFYRPHRQYDVLLCATNEELDDKNAKLIVVYAGGELSSDAETQIEIASRASNRVLSYKGTRIPIYGDSVTFQGDRAASRIDEESQRKTMRQHRLRGGMVVRIGYNLFAEVRTLLTTGQPAAYAGTPTLDMHIALLRETIVANGVSLIEVPPVPEGSRFITCLTHDVDHPSIRRHMWDHTAFGFLYRAVFGSLAGFLRGRISARNLLTNWAAAWKLPFVYAGFAKDFWNDFADRYLEVEKGLRSTFFVIPFKDCPGKNADGMASEFRAARYGARDIADTIQKVTAAGCEVGLHGIDAWRDSSRGREEVEEIQRVTGLSEIGVRMHWLYYDRQSPAVLEQAGAAYDSTAGYNETVGYRAGTTQAYKPLPAARLLELPLHIMDTALFYPEHLGLSRQEATNRIGVLIENAARFGGCLTINWHDRSLAPERLWHACYRDLIEELRNQDAWFATAGQAISWFRKRRSVVFEDNGVELDAVRAKVTAHDGDAAPGLRLRIYNARAQDSGSYRLGDYVDIAFNESVGGSVACAVNA